MKMKIYISPAVEVVYIENVSVVATSEVIPSGSGEQPKVAESNFFDPRRDIWGEEE